MGDRDFDLRAKSDLCSLRIDGLIEETITDFDIYIEVGGHIVLYAPSPYRWSKAELGRLLSDGHGDLFYDKSDVSKVNAYLQISTIPTIDSTLEPYERIGSITDVAAELVKVLHEYPITELTLIKSNEVAESLVDCIKEDIGCIKALTKLSDHDQYTFYHSARVSAYSLAVAMTMGQSDAGLLQDLALGGLLHDVGKIQVGIDVINKPGPLNEREWSLMKKHPEFGIAMVSDSLLSLVPMEIILHHHERKDGKGYPHGLSEPEIIEEVKISGFADTFDALTSARPYQKHKSCYEALNFMKSYLNENLHQDSYKAMVEILAKKNAA